LSSFAAIATIGSNRYHLHQLLPLASTAIIGNHSSNLVMFLTTLQSPALFQNNFLLSLHLNPWIHKPFLSVCAHVDNQKSQTMHFAYLRGRI
jgi:hypothetical protein